MVSGSFWLVSAGFSWFQVVSSGFRWFQIVPRFSEYAVMQSTQCNVHKRYDYQHRPQRIFWKIWVDHINWMNYNKYEHNANGIFTQGLLHCFLLALVKKTDKWVYNLLQFFISYWEKFCRNFSSLRTFNVFLKSLNNYFFRWLAIQVTFLADFQC